MKGIVMIVLLMGLITGCTKHAQTHTERYTCPMHPQVLQDKPGRCPICHMELVKVGAMPTDDALMLNPAQIKLGNITTAPVTMGDVAAETILNGRVIIDQDKSVAISARMAGRVDRLFIKEAGQHVNKGQPLYTLYSEELVVLEKEYLLAVQQRAKNKAYDMFVRAAEKKLLLLGMTPSQINAMTASGDVMPQTVFYATTSGTVSGISIREGQYISEGELLFQLEALDKVWVEADVYAAETHALYEGDVVKVKITGFENAPVDGKVIFINPEFRDESQVLSVRVQIDNPNQRFLPGMHAQIISSKIERRVVYIPRDAIIHDGDQHYAWVMNANESYSFRRILTGAENENMTEVRYGLNEHDNVVVTGAYLLYSEMVLKKGKG